MQKPDHPLEPHRRPDVYAPGEPLPEAGKREPFFAKGGLITLAMLLGIFALQVWLSANGYGGIRTVITKFIFG
jgi:hypothetical protein